MLLKNFIVTAKNMPKYGFLLTCISSNKDRIIDSTILFLCGKIRVRENPYFGIFFTVCMSAGTPLHLLVKT